MVTGRDVIAFPSDNQIDPDIADSFILEPRPKRISWARSQPLCLRGQPLREWSR
jgi:hypothetical protein